MFPRVMKGTLRLAWLYQMRKLTMIAAGVCSFMSGTQAADIEQVYTIPLETFSYVKSGSTYYKYGIQVGIGGGGPQTFEFDTGGEGFYAAYSSGSSWWGGNVTVTTDSFAKQFGSGIAYTGSVAHAGLTFYNSSGTTQILNTAGTVFKIGQANSIVQDSTTLWPNAGDTAPVESHFYGDFGLTLKKGSHGIENVFAQLTYGNGITAGYKVSLGPYGSTTGASVQVGLAATDLSNPSTLWFTMQGQNTTDVFTGSGLPTYSAEVLNSDMTLTLGSETHTFTNLGINLDTGNPTPGIDYNDADKSRLELFSLNSDGFPISLADGTFLELTANPVGMGEPARTVFSLHAGSDYGQNFVYENSRSDGGDTYLNIGALLFQQYDVTFDIQNGLLGLTPNIVPEPDSLGLTALGIGLLLCHKRKRRLKKTTDPEDQRSL